MTTHNSKALVALLVCNYAAMHMKSTALYLVEQARSRHLLLFLLGSAMLALASLIALLRLVAGGRRR